uniref:Uncharacterized protein n=1 Tax=Mustela putorius furo TaxID=9669 RepID=M3YM74_MUSPF
MPQEGRTRQPSQGPLLSDSPCVSVARAQPPAPTPGHQTHTDPQDGPLRPSRSPSTHRTQRLLVSLEIAGATCPVPRQDRTLVQTSLPAPPSARVAPAGTAILGTAGWQVAPRGGAV